MDKSTISTEPSSIAFCKRLPGRVAQTWDVLTLVDATVATKGGLKNSQQSLGSDVCVETDHSDQLPWFSART